MKPSISKIINVDYVSKVLIMMTVLFIIASFVFIFVNNNLLLFITFFSLSVILIIIGYKRINKLSSYINQIKDNKTTAKVLKVTKTRKLLYITVLFHIGQESIQSTLMVPRSYKARQIIKEEFIEVIYDQNNPQKVYLLDLID